MQAVQIMVGLFNIGLADTHSNQAASSLASVGAGIWLGALVSIALISDQPSSCGYAHNFMNILARNQSKLDKIDIFRLGSDRKNKTNTFVPVCNDMDFGISIFNLFQPSCLAGLCWPNNRMNHSNFCCPVLVSCNWNPVSFCLPVPLLLSGQ